VPQLCEITENVKKTSVTLFLLLAGCSHIFFCFAVNLYNSLFKTLFFYALDSGNASFGDMLRNLQRTLY